MGLDLVAVASAVLLLDHVATFRQIGHDAVRPSFGDAQRRGDVPQTDPRVVGDAHQHAGMVGQEAPLGHDRYRIPLFFWKSVASYI